MASINALTSEQVTNFVVKVRIEPSSYDELIKSGNKFSFRPGMSASVSITPDLAPDVLAVPFQAVTSRENNNEEKGETKPDGEPVNASDKEATKYDQNRQLAKLEEIVFLIKGDTVAQVKVTTGIQDDEYIAVTTGLSEGDVIVSGPYRTVSRTLKSGSAGHKKEDKKPVKSKAEESAYKVDESKAIIIFLRNPVLGRVKSRLAAKIGNVEALRIYKRLLVILKDLLEDLPVQKFLFYSDYINVEDHWNNQKFITRLQIQRAAPGCGSGRGARPG